MLAYWPHPYVRVLLKFTHYAQTGIVVTLFCFLYAILHEQLQITACSSLFLKRLFYWSVLMNDIKAYHYAVSYVTVLLEYINHSLQFPQMLDIAINIHFTLPYYASVMLNAFNDLLCSKLCWHNSRPGL